MNVAVLGDTHWGARHDMPCFYKHFEDFYDLMLPELEKGGVRHLLQTGDLFDRRKSCNTRTLSVAKNLFFDPLLDLGIHLHVVVGNHDAHMRESITINTPSLVLGEYKNVTVYTEPTTIDLVGTTFDMIPWICESNRERIAHFIKKSKSDICFGHFEIADFAMHKGFALRTGLDPAIFSKYERVLSGHYHTKSTRGNITYVGAPYEMDWHDFDDPKGYHIFNTDSRALDFHPNPKKVHIKLMYDDTKPVAPVDPASLEMCFVKVVVVNKTNVKQFEAYLRDVYATAAQKVELIEDLSAFNAGNADEAVNLENTIDVIDKYIDSIETTYDTGPVKTLMRELHVEAINQEGM